MFLIENLIVRNPLQFLIFSQNYYFIIAVTVRSYSLSHWNQIPIKQKLLYFFLIHAVKAVVFLFLVQFAQVEFVFAFYQTRANVFPLEHSGPFMYTSWTCLKSSLKKSSSLNKHILLYAIIHKTRTDNRNKYCFLCLCNCRNTEIEIQSQIVKGKKYRGPKKLPCGTPNVIHKI